MVTLTTGKIDDHLLFDALMSKASIGVAFLDRDLRYLRVNDELARLNGVPVDEHYGKYLHEIVPSLTALARPIIDHILSTGQPVENHEFCGETAAQPGVVRCWNQCWYPLRDGSGEVSGFMAIVTEMTEIINAQQEKREKEAWLMGVNQILHSALTCETEKELGLTCLEVAKKITRSKTAFIGEMNERLYDIAISTPGWEACRVLPGGHYQSKSLRIHGIYGRVLSEGKSLLTNNPASHPDSIGFPENHPPVTSFLGVPLFYQGRIFGMIGVGNREGGYRSSEREALEALAPSIVEAFMRKRAKDELEALNHELELRVEKRTLELQKTHSQYLHAEKLAAIGKLSASIAHELNSPLQTVSTVLKVLEYSVPGETQERKLLDAAVGETRRMRDLIRSLQDFYRPSTGRKVLMDVHASIDSVLLLCQIDFSRKKILTGLNYAEKLPQIVAIPDQIKQVFLNLLNNAADALMDRGGVITISTWRDKKRIAVAIQDTGTGIPPENIGLIFMPFFTTKREVKGTGLGLSVCHGIVKGHGGEICVSSEPGEGATFVVYLPIAGHDKASVR